MIKMKIKYIVNIMILDITDDNSSNVVIICGNSEKRQWL